MHILSPVSPLSYAASHSPPVSSRLLAQQPGDATSATSPLDLCTADITVTGRRSQRLKKKPYEVSGISEKPLPRPAKVVNSPRGARPPKKPKVSKQKDKPWTTRSTPRFKTQEDLKTLIALLASAESSAMTWAEEIKKMIAISPDGVDSLRSIAQCCWELGDTLQATGSHTTLSSIVGWCQDLTQRGVIVDFMFMLSCIRLTLKCQK